MTRSLPRLASLLSLALLAACGDGPEPPAVPPAVRRLEMRVLASDSAEQDALDRAGPAGIVRATYLADRDAPPWDVYADAKRFRELEREGETFLLHELESTGTHGITLRAPFAAPRFDLVRVLARSSEKGRIGVIFHVGKRELEFTPSVRVAQRNQLVEYEFDVPRAPSADEPIDSIGLVFSAPTGGVTGVARIELVERCLRGGILPDTRDAPALIAVGPDTRECIIATTGGALECDWPEDGGDSLRVHVALPETVDRPWARPSLRVRVFDADGAERASQSLPLEPRFVAHRVDLASLGGAPGRLRFEIDGDAERQEAALIEVPLVLRAVADAPTVVLITSDTHRADHIGAAGENARVRTPFLDRLASQGAFFEDCFSPANSTAPSHTALLTAVHPRETGVTQNGIRLAERARTLAEAFREAGWVTHAVVSATHLEHSVSGLGQGFDRIAGPPSGEWRADFSTGLALEWANEFEGQPYFLWLHLFDAHTPYEPPEEYRHLEGLLTAQQQKREFLPRTPEVREELYRGEVRWLDDQLADFLGAPRFARAVKALTADHGERLIFEGEGVFDHRTLSVDTLHIPLILSGPGVPVGVRVARGVTHMDLGRTLLDLAGEGRVDFPGRNLLADEEQERPRFGLQAHELGASLRLGRWFLRMDLPTPARVERGEQHFVQLYDLERDPEGVRDIAAEEPERAARMRALLVEWLVAGPQQVLTDQSEVTDERTIAELRKLGYASAGETHRASELFDEGCACAACEEYRRR